MGDMTTQDDRLENWLTLGQAAMKIGCTVRTMQRAVRDGQLKGQLPGGGQYRGHMQLPVLVHRDALAAFDRSRTRIRLQSHVDG